MRRVDSPQALFQERPRLLVDLARCRIPKSSQPQSSPSQKLHVVNSARGLRGSSEGCSGQLRATRMALCFTEVEQYRAACPGVWAGDIQGRERVLILSYRLLVREQR